MIKRNTMFAVAFGLVALASGYLASPAESADDAALVKALGSAKVTLQQGLTVSQEQGQPISKVCEWRTASLASVYTARTEYFEIVIATARLGSPEPSRG